MKPEFNRGVWSVNTDQSVSRSGTKVTRLMTCSVASDDTTNMRSGQGPVAAMAHKVGCDFSKSHDWVCVC
jgi:hypothetical protein